MTKKKKLFDGKSEWLGLCCDCCGSTSLGEKDTFEICDICGWEDDNVQREYPQFAGGANRGSLEDCRLEWRNRGVLSTKDKPPS